MSVIEAISMMSKSGYDDKELLEYIDKHYDELDCELNGDEYKELQRGKDNRLPKIDFSLYEMWFM